MTDLNLHHGYASDWGLSSPLREALAANSIAYKQALHISGGELQGVPGMSHELIDEFLAKRQSHLALIPHQGLSRGYRESTKVG